MPMLSTNEEQVRFFRLLLIAVLLGCFALTTMLWVDAANYYKEAYELVKTECSIGTPIPIYEGEKEWIMKSAQDLIE